MSEKEKDILSLGDDFEVIEDAPEKKAGPAGGDDAARPRAKQPPAPPRGAPAPLRKAVSQGSLGLLLGIGGLLSPYGAAEVAWLAPLAAALATWQLLAKGLGRLQPTAKPLGPGVPALVLVAGLVGLAGAFTGMLNPAGAPAGGVLGGVLAVLGGGLALMAPGMARKADAKLPPPAPEPEVDRSFSLSLAAYGVIVAMLLVPWGGGGAPGVGTYYGAVTLVLCVCGVWASWAGMWRHWGMPAVSGGAMGFALFFAPVFTVVYGLLGASRPLLDPGQGLGQYLEDWMPGTGADFLSHGMPALIALAAGCFATWELFHGAKKAMEANKKRKEEEFAQRKAAREARREQQGGSGSAGKGAGTGAAGKPGRK